MAQRHGSNLKPEILIKCIYMNLMETRHVVILLLWYELFDLQISVRKSKICIYN